MFPVTVSGNCCVTRVFWTGKIHILSNSEYALWSVSHVKLAFGRLSAINFTYTTGSAIRMKTSPVKITDTSCFVPAMLQRIQTKCRFDVDLIVFPHVQKGALFLRTVIVKRAVCNAVHGQSDFSSSSNSSGFFMISAPPSIILSIFVTAAASLSLWSIRLDDNLSLKSFGMNTTKYLAV